MIRVRMRILCRGFDSRWPWIPDNVLVTDVTAIGNVWGWHEVFNADAPVVVWRIGVEIAEFPLRDWVA